MIIGTSYFKDLTSAISYYSYGFNSQQVQNKIDNNEIKIGKPTTQKNQKLILIDGGTRYAIIEG